VAARSPSHVLDHVGLAVSDLAAARAFYVAALEPLGFGVVMEFPGVIALGLAGQPELWMHQGAPSAPIHIAFHAADRARASAPSARPPSPPAEPTTARPGSGRSTTPATTARTCSTPTATTSKPCATNHRTDVAALMLSLPGAGEARRAPFR
jgi:catechol 2,3-dioxygenase-like lactoylglutathione lyase family enzyme